MTWKHLAQTDLSDALIQHHQALEELDGINALMDGSGLHDKERGEQAWSPPLMLKVLPRQSGHGLTAPKLEKQPARGLMFRRLINLGLSEGVPDHSALWRFRNLPLSERQKAQNRRGSSIRSAVERVFGILKQHYGIGKTRHLGLKRDQTRLMLTAMACTIKRGAAILAGMLVLAG